ncbi:TPA: hypothetical protein ACWMJU_006076 [Pseudomonas aeruginosa]
MSKKSKYDKYRVDGWADSSESVLTKGQIEFLIQDEKRMQAAEIAEALKDSKKPFNSVHVQYETNDPNAKAKPVTDAELEEAFLEYVYENSSKIKTSERNKKKPVFNSWEKVETLSTEELEALQQRERWFTIPEDEIEKLIDEALFLDSLPEHPLGKEGLDRAYKNIKDIDIHPDDIDSIK